MEKKAPMRALTPTCDYQQWTDSMEPGGMLKIYILLGISHCELSKIGSHFDEF